MVFSCLTGWVYFIFNYIFALELAPSNFKSALSGFTIHLQYLELLNWWLVFFQDWQGNAL